MEIRATSISYSKRKAKNQRNYENELRTKHRLCYVSSTKLILNKLSTITIKAKKKFKKNILQPNGRFLYSL